MMISLSIDDEPVTYSRQRQTEIEVRKERGGRSTGRDVSQRRDFLPKR